MLVEAVVVIQIALHVQALSELGLTILVYLPDIPDRVVVNIKLDSYLPETKA